MTPAPPHPPPAPGIAPGFESTNSLDRSSHLLLPAPPPVLPAPIPRFHTTPWPLFFKTPPFFVFFLQDRNLSHPPWAPRFSSAPGPRLCRPTNRPRRGKFDLPHRPNRLRPHSVPRMTALLNQPSQLPPIGFAQHLSSWPSTPAERPEPSPFGRLAVPRPAAHSPPFGPCLFHKNTPAPSRIHRPAGPSDSWSGRPLPRCFVPPQFAAPSTSRQNPRSLPTMKPVFPCHGQIAKPEVFSHCKQRPQIAGPTRLAPPVRPVFTAAAPRRLPPPA